MYRMLRLGAPALALALIVGCGAQDAPGPGDVETNRPAPGNPPVVTPSTDEMPNPGPNRTDEPSAPIPSETDVSPPAEADPKVEAAPKADEAPKPDAAPTIEGPQASKVDFTEDELANIRKLPAGEQEAALKQGVCPVSGENLGMDVPIKMTAEGRDFYICCEGCKGPVEKDPKGVLAKLDKK